MTAHGFTVESTEEADLSAFKEARGVPRDAWSCHTAVIDGYTVEGHVPVEAIEDLLTDRPDIDGIALPGMPPGRLGCPARRRRPSRSWPSTTACSVSSAHTRGHAEPPQEGSPPMSDDPLVTNPGLYRLVMENDRVRVLEYRDRPGDRTRTAPSS